jgi:hypothetical protein
LATFRLVERAANGRRTCEYFVASTDDEAVERVRSVVISGAFTLWCEGRLVAQVSHPHDEIALN